MNFPDDGRDNYEYECINRTILDGNVVNMSLVITEGNYGDIEADDSTFHGYYIIRFYSSPYTHQAYLIIHGQVGSSVEMVYE